MTKLFFGSPQVFIRATAECVLGFGGERMDLNETWWREEEEEEEGVKHERTSILLLRSRYRIKIHG